MDDSFMWLMLWPYINLLIFGLWVYCIIDVVRNKFVENNKLIWVIVVIFIPLIGSICYLGIGRKQRLKLN